MHDAEVTIPINYGVALIESKRKHNSIVCGEPTATARKPTSLAVKARQIRRS